MKTTPRADAPANHNARRGVHAIRPTAVYFLADLARLYGFTRSTISTAHKRHGLKVGRRLGKTFILGSWLLAWFARGELPSRTPAEPVSSGRRPIKEDQK